MDNPAVHDLDDVRLRAENGQLVLEVAGQTVPVNVDVDGNLSLDELEGFTDDEISLLQSKLVNAGHDEVDVPQVRNLTVEDWESGTLDTDVWEGDVDSATVQSSVVLQGDYSLELDSGSGITQIGANTLQNQVQLGDKFTVYTQLSDGEDKSQIAFLMQDATTRWNTTPSLTVELLAKTNRVNIVRGGPNDIISGNSIPISDNLNEPIRIDVSLSLDRQIVVDVYDSAGNVLTSDLSEQIPTDIPDSGGIQFESENNSVSSVMYFDGPYIQRRVGEYTSDTQKGTTELGNEVTPSGAIHTGPLESNTNAARAEYANAPVNSNATQGDQSLLTLLKSGVNPAMYMERTMDGQGGAYGHQLQTALGRFARINANLSWEYESLAEVPNWESSADLGSNWTFNINGRPRRIHVETDGSGDFAAGGVGVSNLSVPDTLGGFRVTFHNVSYSETGDNVLSLGFSSASPDLFWSNNGDGVFYRNSAGNDDLILRDDVSAATFGLSSSIDWTQNHDISVEYDGTTAGVLVDGELRVSKSKNLSNDFKIGIQLRDQGGNTTSETVEVEQVTVEPLPEVLQ